MSLFRALAARSASQAMRGLVVIVVLLVLAGAGIGAVLAMVL